MRLLPRLPLSVVLPLGLTLALLALLATGALSSANRREAMLRDSADAYLRSVAYNLALEAEDHSDASETSRLWLQAAQVWTDPRIHAVAVIAPDGRIVVAQRSDWQGRPATELLPGYDPEHARQGDPRVSHPVRWSADGRRASIQVSYLAPQEGTRTRRMQHGSIYAEADLSDELNDVLCQTLRTRQPERFISVLLLLLLMLWLRRKVTRPLAALERASRHLASEDLSARVPEEGPQEITRLACSFNQMAQALQHADVERRTSEERLSTILYSTGEAVLATDTTQRITLLNRVAEQLTGWTEAEALGRPVAQVFRIEHADTGLPAEIPVARVLAERQVVGLAKHTVLVSRDGQRRHIADNAAPVRRSDGQLIGVVLVFSDISAAYQLERALADSEWHYRSLANSGRVLIWTADREGGNTWCNELWQRYTGQDSAAAAGAGWLDAVHPDDRNDLRATFQQARTYQRPWSMELRLRQTDGSYRWMLCDAAPQHDSTGRYLGHIGHCIDISAQRDSQAQLQRQLAELSRLQSAMLGREGRIASLKQEVNQLLLQQGAAPRYASASEREPEPS
ncbi:MAG: PAS domain S-box protein [Leptothrix sp. (in: b-proteobacteria)]